MVLAIQNYGTMVLCLYCNFLVLLYDTRRGYPTADGATGPCSQHLPSIPRVSGYKDGQMIVGGAKKQSSGRWKCARFGVWKCVHIVSCAKE